eukprot:gene57823-biopygen29096
MLAGVPPTADARGYPATICYCTVTFPPRGDCKGRALFNAASACSGHRAAAIECAVRASSVKGADGRTASREVGWVEAAARFAGAGDVTLSVGTASGDAWVGNVGSDTLRAFNVLSTLAPWASALERVSAQGIGACVVDAALTAHAQGRALRTVPLRVQHCKHHPQSVARLCSIEGALKAETHGTTASDEWMYKQEAEEARNPFREYNEAAVAYLHGDLATAQRFLAMRGDELVRGEGSMADLLALISRAAAADDADGRPPAPVLLHDAAALPWLGTGRPVPDAAAPPRGVAAFGDQRPASPSSVAGVHAEHRREARALQLARDVDQRQQLQ